MKYEFIREHASHYPVNRLCRGLNVQRSAYYDWRACPGKVIAPEALTLRRRMQALFAASRGSLGSRTMMNTLREEGFEIGRDRTRRLMKTAEAYGQAEAQIQGHHGQQTPVAGGGQRIGSAVFPVRPQSGLGD